MSMVKLNDYINPRNLIATGAITAIGVLAACGGGNSAQATLQEIFDTQRPVYTQDLSGSDPYTRKTKYETTVGDIDYELIHKSGAPAGKGTDSYNSSQQCDLVISGKGTFVDLECDGTLDLNTLRLDNPDEIYESGLEVFIR